MEALSKKHDLIKEQPFSFSAEEIEKTKAFFSSSELDELYSSVDEGKNLIVLCKVVIRILDEAKNRGVL